MQPWKVSVGLTAAAAGVTLILCADAFPYLTPFWAIIFEDYWLPITLHLSLAILTFASLVYGAARAIGLGDLGKKMDLMERSLRRGTGDRELADALKRDEQGDWQ